MPTLKVLSGKDLVKILSKFDFQIQSQKGSHIKLARFSESGNRQILVNPNHKGIDKGTLRGIYKQATKYISDEKLFDYFFIK